MNLSIADRRQAVGLLFFLNFQIKNLILGIINGYVVLNWVCYCWKEGMLYAAELQGILGPSP